MSNGEVTIDLLEQQQSRTSRSNVFAGPSNVEDAWDLAFYIRPCVDECTARARVEDPINGLPTEWRGQPLREYELTRIGYDIWEVRAAYAWLGPRLVDPQVLPTAISYSTQGGNIKLTQAISEINRWPDSTMDPDNLAPDFNKALNWDGRTVGGITIGAPQARYSESWIWRADQIWKKPVDPQKHDDYIKLWAAYTATVHGYIEVAEDQRDPATPVSSGLDNFRGWVSGEVRFDGAQLRQVGTAHYEVNFEFSIQPTKRFYLPKTVDPSDPRDVIVADGWDHIEYFYTQQETEAGTGGASPYKAPTSLPKFVYQYQVYPRRDFQHLGIGTKAFDGSFAGLIGC